MTEQARMYGRVLYELHLPEEWYEMKGYSGKSTVGSDTVRSGATSFKKDRIIEKVWRASEFTEIVPSFLKRYAVRAVLADGRCILCMGTVPEG